MITREEVYKYINKEYDAEPEYLWDDTPDAAIFRHQNNKKWFALIMNVKNDVYLNVKTDPSYSELLRKAYDYIIPAYHMNKEHWNTIILNRDVERDVVYELIAQSYELTTHKRGRKNYPQ